MNTSKYLPYAVAALIGVGIALWAGMPAYLILVLLCPVTMFFMMSSMSGGNTGHADNQDDSAGGTQSQNQEGSHQRIDRP